MPENSSYYPQVIQRYTSYDPLSGVNEPFIAALLRAFDEKTFCADDFSAFPVEMIVEYIKRTHIFYLQKKLPEIEQSIVLLSSLYNSHHPMLAILQNFFHQYFEELTTHIREEETKLLPHIELLRRSVKVSGHLSQYILARQKYSVAGFLADHHDTEDELRDIRHAIGLYEPPATNASLYRILLGQLEAFEQDLRVHAHIEDQVLIPMALQMETTLNELLGKMAQSN